MMRALDSVLMRSLLVSVIGITLVHLLSLWSYEHALDRELQQANVARLAEHMVAIKRSVMRLPPAGRDAMAHDLSAGPVEVHWTAARTVTAGGNGTAQWQALVAAIRDLAPGLGAGDVIVGTGPAADPHVALVSMRLPDDSWINFSLFAVGRPRASHGGTILSTSLMTLGVMALAALLARLLTRPIRGIAQAAAALDPDREHQGVAEDGPKEVRELAQAFNAMHRRIRDLVRRRTQSLAAVSHDLRTPLTRLRLRLEDAGDPKLRSEALADIGEMDAMIETTLAYLRGDDGSEQPRRLDLTALLQSIVDDARDAGHEAVLLAPASVIVEGRHLGLKRGLRNLIDNAVQYGGGVEVRLEAAARPDEVEVVIADRGPGIPEAELATVLEPFVRLEASRNRQTGGVGLGLTIARAALEADGGSLALRNRPGGGLEAVARLPRKPA